MAGKYYPIVVITKLGVFTFVYSICFREDSVYMGDGKTSVLYTE